MADESASDAEVQERATVRLVSEQVRGLRDLTQAGFADLQRQLDAVASVPVVMARLEAQNADQEKRIASLEGANTRDRDWRRIHLPGLILSAVLAVAAIATIITQLH